MNGVHQDLRFALRTIRKNPGFTAVAVLTLSVGLGASTAIFSLFSAVVLRMPFQDAARLLRVYDSRRREDGQSSLTAVSQRNFFEIRARARSFERVVAGIYRNVSVRADQGNQRFAGIGVSEGWLPALGVRPILGREFTPEEERAGSGSRSVLVSYGVWQTVLGGATDLRSRRLDLDGASFDVVGVLPRGFRFPWESDLWFPWTFERDNGREHNTMVLGRLRMNVSRAAARSELDAISGAVAREYPETNLGFFFTPVPIAEDLTQGRQRLLVCLAAAVGLLLALACANVASLLLARALSRQREQAIRQALGATLARQLSQTTVENLILTLPAAALGVFLSYAIRAFLRSLLPDGVASAVPDVAPQSSEVMATLALTFLVALTLAFFTTFRATRRGTPSALSSARSTTGDREAHRTLHALVVGEVAISFTLLFAAAALLENFVRLQRADLGFESRNLLTAAVAVPPTREFGSKEKNQLEEELIRRVAPLPAVVSVSAGDHVPLMVSNSSAAFTVESRVADPHEQLVVNFREVGVGYFETLGIRLLRGRSFDSRDGPTSLPVCLVSRSMARRFFRNTDPIGKRVRRNRANQQNPWTTIVGVVDDVREPRLAGGIQEAWYVPAAQSSLRDSNWDYRQVLLAIRTAGPPGPFGPVLRGAVAGYDPSLTVYDVRTGTETRNSTFAPERTSSYLLVFFAAFGLLLASTGTYGVLAYVVRRNRGEIGVRAALGASPARTLAEQLSRGGRLVALGLAIGVAGSAGLARLMAAAVPGAKTSRPLLLLAETLFLGAVGALACYLPARRASRIDPMTALREE